MLELNVGGIDRLARWGVGILALAAGIFLLPSGGLKVAAIVLGLLGLATGTIGFCPAYLPFGLSTGQNRA